MPGHLASAYRCLRLREQPGTSASQVGDPRKGGLCLCESLKARLEPAAWELCFSASVSALAECPRGGAGGPLDGLALRPCCCQSDSDPLLAPACSGSASCSFGSWRLGWFFTSISPRTEPGRRGADFCVSTLFSSPSTGVRGEEVEATVLGSGFIPCDSSGLPRVLLSTYTMGHQVCWTNDQAMWYLNARVS